MLLGMEDHKLGTIFESENNKDDKMEVTQESASIVESEYIQDDTMEDIQEPEAAPQDEKIEDSQQSDVKPELSWSLKIDSTMEWNSHKNERPDE
jgi:hypothetical protein